MQPAVAAGERHRGALLDDHAPGAPRAGHGVPHRIPDAHPALRVRRRHDQEEVVDRALFAGPHVAHLVLADHRERVAVDHAIGERLAVVGHDRVLHLEVPGGRGIGAEPAHVGNRHAADRDVAQLALARREHGHDRGRHVRARDPDQIARFDQPGRLLGRHELALVLALRVDREIQARHGPSAWAHRLAWRVTRQPGGAPTR